ncbi:MAG: hypothetical protein K0Q51_1432 [Rickettsiaceae bacterium]|jgi:hypothetical protein|nr:hypothetical protein [Rickettsiaceae bacterium]
MLIKKFINTLEGTIISEIYTIINTVEPRLVILYSNHKLAAYKIKELPNLLNQSLFNNFFDESLRKKIIQETNGIIEKKENGLYDFRVEIASTISKDDSNFEIIKDFIDTIGDFSSLFSLKLQSKLPWYVFPVYFKYIVESASKIMYAFPNAKIFSLGQSPAWIVKAAEYLSIYKPYSNFNQEFGYIPFSSNFYRLIKEQREAYDKPVHAIYEVSFSNLSSYSEQIKCYIDLLGRLGLNSIDIIKRYESLQQKTVIIDFTHTGAGLASFISIMFGSLKEASSPLSSINMLKEAIEILVLDDYQEETESLKTITIEEETIGCTHMLTEQLEGMELMWSLANGIDHGIDSDRLVPYYPLQHWHQPIPFLEYNETIHSINVTLEAESRNLVSLLTNYNYTL